MLIEVYDLSTIDIMLFEKVVFLKDISGVYMKICVEL